ncbi:glycosyltransferase family 9 protein [Sulfurospirillum arcachonense]|uniref:glycosyltransferase family 9 protein n=1 Tax=Sulfurospirillum arcachonense TaxID=57666 RepID=UPI0004681EB7|nr:glycosyltransferase family 9 protein [Sulfurospirillum arcachonense]
MNILITRFSSLGDLVTLSLILRAIRYFYPKHNITFLTSNIGKELYQDTDFADNYIVHKNYLQSIKEIRKYKYNIVFNLHCNSLSHFLLLFAKKQKTVNSAANLLQKLLHIKVTVNSIKNTLIQSGLNEYTVDKYINNENYKNIYLPTKETQLIKTNKKVIVISTGSSEKWQSKQWGINNYINLIEKLILNNFKVVLVGTKLELNDANKVVQKFPNVINFVNKTDLTGLKQIIKQADIYIGNDSGPSHIAASVGTSTITIFGSTDIKHCVKFEKYIGKHLYIKPSEDIKCHPCYKSICPTKHECMESITTSQVYDLVQELKGSI